MEKEIGACVLALEPKVKLRDLSDDELKKLRAAEDEPGVVLMAYECE